MKNVNIVIIGATGDIGSNLTRQFASMGANVVAVGRNQKTLEDLGSFGRNIKTYTVTTCTVADIKNLISTTEARFAGAPDILITSVGKWERVDKDSSNEYFESQLSVDLASFVGATVVPIFVFNQYFNKTRGGGFIVDISSHAAKSLLQGNLTYAPAKVAVKAFVDNLRNENGPFSNIRISQVVSQLVDTPKNRAAHPQITDAEWATAVQIGDIANWIEDNWDNPDAPTEQFFKSGVVL